MSDNTAVVIMCPPYPEFEEAPEDQGHCELFDCPKCKSKMWLSDKKKGILMFSSCINKEIILGCFDCIKKILIDDPDIFLRSVKLDI